MAAEAQRAIEAILMVADSPVEPGLLAQLLEITPARVEEICATLAGEYEGLDRGFVLVRVAGGYRFQSHPDLAPYVERFVLEGQTARLSAAALETLAIVAYKQPVSRAQISAIRGVNADGVLRSLEQRGYIAEVGRDPGPGQALLYGTTAALLERLGLDTLDELPALADFVPGPEIMEALEHSLRFHPERRDGPVAAGDALGPDPGGVSPRPARELTGDVDLSELPADVDLSERHREVDLSEPDPDVGPSERRLEVDLTDAESAGEGDFRARIDAENAPGTDEGGIDDFRADDYRTDGFRLEGSRRDDPGGDDGSW